LNVPAACLVPYGNLTRDCSGNRLVKLVFRPLFVLAYCYLSCSLGLTMRRMFRSYGESFYRRRLDQLGNYRAWFYLFYRIRTKVHILVDPMCSMWKSASFSRF
jgi:hypothetical protein